MMKDFKMRFKDFVFPSNPTKIEICAKRDIATNSVYDNASVTQNIAPKPIVVSGKGTFYGKDAEKVCSYLSHLVKLGSSGMLHYPSLYPIDAFFEEFSYSQNALKDGFDYSFSFVENCSGEKEKIDLDYTFLSDDENLFAVAKRVGVSIDTIMELNDFDSPFYQGVNERVKIR